MSGYLERSAAAGARSWRTAPEMRQSAAARVARSGGLGAAAVPDVDPATGTAGTERADGSQAGRALLPGARSPRAAAPSGRPGGVRGGHRAGPAPDGAYTDAPHPTSASDGPEGPEGPHAFGAFDGSGRSVGSARGTGDGRDGGPRPFPSGPAPDGPRRDTEAPAARATHRQSAGRPPEPSTTPPPPGAPAGPPPPTPTRPDDPALRGPDRPSTARASGRGALPPAPAVPPAPADGTGGPEDLAPGGRSTGTPRPLPTRAGLPAHADPAPSVQHRTSTGPFPAGPTAGPVFVRRVADGISVSGRASSRDDDDGTARTARADGHGPAATAADRDGSPAQQTGRGESDAPGPDGTALGPTPALPVPGGFAGDSAVPPATDARPTPRVTVAIGRIELSVVHRPAAQAAPTGAAPARGSGGRDREARPGLGMSPFDRARLGR